MNLAIDTLGGLPAHPAVVHLPVVMVPLALVLTLLAVWPRVRAWALPGATAAALLGMVGASLAESSGEALEDSVRRTPLLREHTETAEAVMAFLVPFVLLLLVALVLHSARTGRFPLASRLTPLTTRVLPRLAAVRAGVLAAFLAVTCVVGGLAA
ncbi:MAG: DUF2231 domain-containing protein, partial [Ilumatobacteraceae bacterium]